MGCYLEILEKETEGFFEEKENGLDESEGLGWIESVYKVGHCCFCVLAHLKCVECELGGKK